MAITCRIYVYAGVKEYQWAEKEAERAEIPISQYVRAMILEKYLEKDENQFNPEEVLLKAKHFDRMPRGRPKKQETAPSVSLVEKPATKKRARKADK